MPLDAHYHVATRPRSESKTKKTVRIRSPEFSPIAPDYTRTTPLPDIRTAVPPPPPAAFKSSSPASSDSSDDTPIDPFESRFPPVQSRESEAEDDRLLRNTQSNSGNPEINEAATGGPLSNPFSKTLATMEAGIASVVPQPQEKFKLAKLDDAVPQKLEKPAMDVDSFTRMLMTGRTESPPAQVRIQNQGPAVDSNSSTDASSISRQSMSDTLQGPGTESPRTSYEMSNADDDEPGLVTSESSTPSLGKEKRAPPPPKHRHGKSVSSKGPQTVSFDDFTASLKQNLPTAPLGNSTDTNKPLPSLPNSIRSEPIVPVDLDREKTPTPATINAPPVTSESPSRAPSQKKAPPPVPLARRQSQMKSQSQTRSRSNSALTTGSQEGSSYPPSLTESTSSSKMPPPPPPTRRHGNQSNTPTSTDLTNSSTPRTALGQALSSSQQSSQTNLSNTPPPPPPPRRRRSSGRNSFDQTQNAGDVGRASFDSTRRSMDSVSALTSPIEETPERDVLADMDAFQREIDELRKAQDKP